MRPYRVLFHQKSLLSPEAAEQEKKEESPPPAGEQKNADGSESEEVISCQRDLDKVSLIFCTVMPSYKNFIV